MTPQEVGSAQQCTPDAGNGGGGGTEDQEEPCCNSPILLSLSGARYFLTSVPEGVRFDLRNEGVERQVAWTEPGADIAFLALDRNRNGRIDSGAELFGDSTRLTSGRLALHGFEALRELDDTFDGVLDARDAAWDELLLWTDRNHDGDSSADELTPVSNTQVTALNTECHFMGRRDQWGNEFRYMSRFELDGANYRPYYDVFLQTGD